MLSNDFWRGFLGGAALVLAIFFVSRLFARLRAKNRQKQP
jgi:hypothetical protein